MPDWTVRRRLPVQPAWHILPEDVVPVYHPFRRPEQDVIKWQNQVYAVTRRTPRSVVYVPVPLPPGTAIGRPDASCNNDN
jgi:hypothetical protein